MSQEKKSTVGDPIWVESIYSPEDYRQAAKMYPSMFTNGPVAPQYVEDKYKGGTWRDGMGAGLHPDYIKRFNKGIDELRKLITTKTFQRRPDYGPHAEAKP